MSAKHTPGPWTVGADASRESLIPVFGAGRIVAHTPHTRQGFDDATLIAAAPDLFEALTRIAAEPCDHGAGALCARETARDAIAAARGQS